MNRTLCKYIFYCFWGVIGVLGSITCLYASSTNGGSEKRIPAPVQGVGVGNEVLPYILKCYPNPASSYIIFDFDKKVGQSSRLIIYSFTGRKMTELTINNLSVRVTLDGYFRGLYLYQLVSANGRILESGKFQVLN